MRRINNGQFWQKSKADGALAAKLESQLLFLVRTWVYILSFNREFSRRLELAGIRGSKTDMVLLLG